MFMQLILTDTLTVTTDSVVGATLVFSQPEVCIRTFHF